MTDLWTPPFSGVHGLSVASLRWEENHLRLVIEHNEPTGEISQYRVPGTDILLADRPIWRVLANWMVVFDSVLAYRFTHEDAEGDLDLGAEWRSEDGFARLSDSPWLNTFETARFCNPYWCDAKHYVFYSRCVGFYEVLSPSEPIVTEFPVAQPIIPPDLAHKAARGL